METKSQTKLEFEKPRAPWFLDPRIKIKPPTENCMLGKIIEGQVLLTTAHLLEV